MAFETVPVVHLQAGRFPEFPSADPERALTSLARRFGRVVLVDAEGVRANEPDVEFLQVASRRRSIWADAGSRYAEDAMDLFVAGAETVTLRWHTLHDAKQLEEAAELAQPGALLLALEFPRGGFLRNPRDARGVSEVAAWAERLGVGLVCVVDGNDLHALRNAPPNGVTRWLQGAPRGLAEEAERLGFEGILLAPAELPPEETA